MRLFVYLICHSHNRSDTISTRIRPAFADSFGEQDPVMKYRNNLFLSVFALLVVVSSSAWALTDREYSQKSRRMKAIQVSTYADLQQVRASRPTAALDIRGQISGVVGGDRAITVMIRMRDGDSVEVQATGKRADIQPGAWVKCLAHTKPGSSALLLDAVIVDLSPGEDNSPQTGNLKIVMPVEPSVRPVVPPAQAQSPSTRPAPLTSRGGSEEMLQCKRAIAYFNPRLALTDVESIAANIVTYSNSVGIDPYFVVAVVAAESRFNPNARSYKGAMGLGQLMPGTAAGMGVTDAYDPAQNLAAAILILRRNLEKYKDQGTLAPALALAAYNAGAGAVKKHGGVPPYRETRNYIWKVYEYYCWMKGVTPQKR